MRPVRTAFKIRFAEKPDEAPENTEAAENSDELIDDYTGPADAKSVAHDLRTTMRELTIRMLATGVSTAVLNFGVAHCGIRLQCQ